VTESCDWKHKLSFATTYASKMGATLYASKTESEYMVSHARQTSLFSRSSGAMPHATANCLSVLSRTAALPRPDVVQELG
jgi:hypothetical protein